MCAINFQFIDPCSLKVELAHGGRGQSVSVGRGGRHGSGGNKFGVSHRSEFRGSEVYNTSQFPSAVIVKGLPSSASWQDLKVCKLLWGYLIDCCFHFLGFTPLTSQDHMRKAGDVCFAQVFRDGDGRS
ncbi:hypothetical protein GW17_00047177 [Ensete ventricosum]|nr:hypothetical protein GW17_00047177 [Ensete ventricosum]